MTQGPRPLSRGSSDPVGPKPLPRVWPRVWPCAWSPRRAAGTSILACVARTLISAVSCMFRRLSEFPSLLPRGFGAFLRLTPTRSVMPPRAGAADHTLSCTLAKSCGNSLQLRLRCTSDAPGNASSAAAGTVVTVVIVVVVVVVALVVLVALVLLV